MGKDYRDEFYRTSLGKLTRNYTNAPNNQDLILNPLKNSIDENIDPNQSGT